MATEHSVEKADQAPQSPKMASGSSNGFGMGGGSPVLLADTLPLYPSSKGAQQVFITQENITCTPVTGKSKSLTVLAFADISGCDCMKGRTKNDESAYLTIYAYPHKKKFASRKTLRQRQTLTLTFNKQQSFEENTREATKWKHLILRLSKKLSIDSSEDLCSLEVPAPKKYLVLVNPFSGPGKALSMFKTRAVPMFAEANIEYKLIITEYAGHAKKFVQNIDLHEWDGIIIVSGDGLIYELINGLMARPDWEEAIKIPIGALPGGSGNALCCALNYMAREPYLDQCFLHSSFLLTKPLPLPMDIVAVDTCKERVYSFLDITWGMIADVDIESERYRSLGAARFTVGAIQRIIGLRKYRGRLSFLPVKKYERLPPKLKRSKSTDVPSPRQKEAVLTRSQSQVEEFEQHSENNWKKRSKSQPALEPLAEAPPPANGEIQDDVFPEDDRANNLVKVPEPEPANVECSATANGTTEKPGQSERPEVPTPLLPPLSEPVPADWVTIEDDFIFVLAVYQTHLGSDNISTPWSKLDDGFIHMGIGRGALSRSEVLGLFTAMSEGNIESHISHNMECFPVKALRLEPITPNGIITVDGERVDYGPIQAQVLPGLSRVMTLQK